MHELMSKLKQQIVEQLNLKDVKPEEIGDDQPLFMEGLGLDLIDAIPTYCFVTTTIWY